MSRAWNDEISSLAWNPPPGEPPPDDEADAEAMFRAFGSAGVDGGGDRGTRT